MNINDCVLLKIDLVNEGLKKGMQGVVVAIFDKPEIAYEVEFCDDQGKTIEVVALKPEHLEKIDA
ncbi:MAG: DUF4926 domain-containing protein [Nitrosomonas sp.]|nr:DUF4926 domain-containing protein [Nitrosomonas sp.]MCW5599844.1 DUF4926 domain-containing protein [Nitrosomonas sp.]MCW5608898.1 DUF4926 domain-containing protein [Nitrosomonas sp.]